MAALQSEVLAFTPTQTGTGTGTEDPGMQGCSQPGGWWFYIGIREVSDGHIRGGDAGRQQQQQSSSGACPVTSNPPIASQ